MKALLTLLTLTISLNSPATEWLTYYVYFETEYIQGTWTRADLLEESHGKYLAAEAYEDLFGSGDDQLVDKLISRLKSKKPDLYNWTYDLAFRGDTVIITTKKQVENMATVRNEITATLVFNHFKAVTFHSGNSSETWTGNDLTVPYFDLVTRQQSTKTVTEPVKSDRPAEPAEKKNPWGIWLAGSIILNLGLAGFLITKKNKPGA